MIIFIIFQDSPLAGFPQLVCVEAQKSKRAILPETELKIRNQRTAYFCSARENSWKSFSERARNLCVWKLIIIMKRWCERRCHSKWVQSWVFSVEKSGMKQNIKIFLIHLYRYTGKNNRKKTYCWWWWFFWGLHLRLCWGSRVIC